MTQNTQLDPKSTLYSNFVTLRQYQDWRLGLDIRTLNDIPSLSPKKLTEAINGILEAFGFNQPTTDCTDCIHNKDTVYCNRAAKGFKCLYTKRTNDESKNTQTNEGLPDLPF